MQKITSLWRVAAQRLPPASFAFVMATGIISTGFATIGQAGISSVLLVVAVGSLVVLVVLTVTRLVLFRADVMQDARNPALAFGFFTVVAALNVVGIRLYSADAPEVTITLGILSVPLWLLCTYGIPGNLILRPRAEPVASDIDGSWFLWVVGTQSLATCAATLGAGTGQQVLAAIAVSLWGIGVVLYLMLATLVTLRLLTVPSAPENFKPTYWIYMGATAITVLAGSRILSMPPDQPIMAVTAPVVSGLTYVLWSFGLWWIPLLVIFGVWRYGVRRVPLRYEAGLWSMVFPLGMYSVASMHFGGVARLSGLVLIGEVGIWIAGGAWLIVCAGMLFTGWRYVAR